jgi:serine/threonine protein kinase
MPSGCLHENEVQALLEGALPSARVDGVESHLDACLKCQLLVSAAVRTASLRTHGLDGEASGRLHFEVGDVVSSRYEITRFIARGGMGEVYAAHDRMLGDEIALKVLLRPASASAGALDRLRAEVQLARRVADPHVLRVFDLGSYQRPDDRGEVLFLTMQLLAGETLRARIRRAGPLSSAETWRLASDMFAALGAAHRIGIVHRDFKSDNVMLVPTPDGPPRAIVMDFGLAQAVATDAPRRVTDDGAPLVAGTLGYMAPESSPAVRLPLPSTSTRSGSFFTRC